MKLIRHDDLRRTISIKLTIARPSTKRTLEIVQEQQRDALLDEIMSCLAGCVIARPDMDGYQPGRFGVTEPHPLPALLSREDKAELEALAAQPRSKGL